MERAPPGPPQSLQKCLYFPAGTTLIIGSDHWMQERKTFLSKESAFDYKVY